MNGTVARHENQGARSPEVESIDLDDERGATLVEAIGTSSPNYLRNWLGNNYYLPLLRN